jgi:anti-sigma factor RsiW
MTMTHEQIDEQMVDFLYGELPADARAAFEAHVAGCERCRREVESFGQVRAVARTVLDEAPPARAHDAILRAAREAAAASTSATAAAAAPALVPGKKPDTAGTKKAEPARASLWDWLRGRWAFPTLATVGALGVFILGSRLFLNPDTVREIGRPVPVSEPAASTPAPSPAAPGVPAAASGARPAVAAPVPAEAPEPATPARRNAAEAKKAHREGARHAAAPPPAGAGSGGLGVAAKKSVAVKDDPLAGLIGAPTGAGQKSAKGDAFDAELDRIASGGPPRDKAPAAGGGKGYAQPPPAAEKPMANVSSSAGGKKSKKALRAADDMEDDRLSAKEEASHSEPLEGEKRVYAQPPPPAAAPAPAPRYADAPPPRAAAAGEPESVSASDESAEPAKSAPRRVERPAPRARGSASAPAPEPAPALASAPASASRARSRADEAESGDSDQVAVRETLRERADRLFTQGRWAEAAIAYRDLLRQQPSSPDAARWRRRLAAARSAVATGRPPPPSAR